MVHGPAELSVAAQVCTRLRPCRGGEGLWLCVHNRYTKRRPKYQIFRLFHIFQLVKSYPFIYLTPEKASSYRPLIIGSTSPGTQ